MDGSLELDLWDLVIEVLRTTQRIPKPTQACTRETSVKTRITPKIEQVLARNVDLSNIDQVLANAHLSEKESKLYIFEDNDAVIKKGHQRQKSDDETCFPHPPSCPGLVTRQNQPGPKSPNQVCRIQKPTRRHFNKRLFHA